MVDFLDPGPIEFDARVFSNREYRSVKYVQVPFDPYQTYGTRGNVPVRMTVTGTTRSASLGRTIRDDTREIVPVLSIASQEKIADGDVVRVRIELDAPQYSREPVESLALAAFVRHFDPTDGALVDIVVENTTETDWRDVLSSIMRGPSALNYDIGGVVGAPLAADAFAPLDDELRPINFDIGRGILAIAHLFVDWEIEFVIDPRDVATQLDLDCIQSFMKHVGGLTKTPVLLCTESYRDAEEFAYWPDSGVFTERVASTES